MNNRKKLGMISIIRNDRRLEPVKVKYNLPDRVEIRESRVYSINQVPCKIEYTDDGIKVWVIN